MINERERLVFDELARSIDRDGYSPTLRQIAERVGFSHEIVRQQLIGLEAIGLIKRAPGKTRAIKILRRPAEARAA